MYSLTTYIISLISNLYDFLICKFSFSSFYIPKRLKPYYIKINYGNGTMFAGLQSCLAFFCSYYIIHQILRSGYKLLQHWLCLCQCKVAYFLIKYLSMSYQIFIIKILSCLEPFLILLGFVILCI